jgi:hypothetical protein
MSHESMYTPGKTFTMSDELAEHLMHTPRRDSSRIERTLNPPTQKYVMTGSSSASKCRGRKPKNKR